MPALTDRNLTILRRVRSGERPAHIARDLGISKQRVEQVLNRAAMNARRTLWRAVQRGILNRPETCEECGSADRITAHHRDYQQPLTVEFLCPPCHAAADIYRRRIAAGCDPENPCCEEAFPLDHICANHRRDDGYVDADSCDDFGDDGGYVDHEDAGERAA